MDDATDLAAVQRYLDAWARGDIAAILDAYDPDLTLVWPGSHALAGTHAGLDAALGALAALQERTSRTLTRVVSVTPAAGTVDAEVVEHWSVGEISRTLRFTTRAGRIATCTVIEHDQPRVDRALT